MKAKHKRFLIWVVCLASVSLGLLIILRTFRAEITFFKTPTEALLLAKPSAPFRLGGFVKAGSVEKNQGIAFFTVYDKQAECRVRYGGALPDLFREEQAIVAQGAWQADNLFYATEVLAKHDETYKPRWVEKP